MAKHDCNNCPWRAKYDNAPGSWLGRLWRWHIRFCPGWKAHLASLPEDERATTVARYALR